MKKSVAAVTAALSLSSIVGGVAYSQSPAAPAAGNTGAAAGLQEVVVTAERVRESSQRAPVALNTLT
ncbi:MAG: hypothetical protein KGJ72_13395, partial [Gammaproteobacteria bacterium]|nr:hypothetical protein [Gammaproteobacteria bacterium]